MPTTLTPTYDRPKKPFVKRSIHKFLASYLPRKIKRLILLGSIIGYISEHYSATIDMVSLNKILNLARDEKAVELPMHINTLVWSHANKWNCDKQMLINKNSILENKSIIIEHFLRNIPNYLVYDSGYKIKKDLDLCLNSL